MVKRTVLLPGGLFCVCVSLLLQMCVSVCLSRDSPPPKWDTKLSPRRSTVHQPVFSSTHTHTHTQSLAGAWKSDKGVRAAEKRGAAVGRGHGAVPPRGLGTRSCCNFVSSPSFSFTLALPPSRFGKASSPFSPSLRWLESKRRPTGS